MVMQKYRDCLLKIEYATDITHVFEKELTKNKIFNTIYTMFTFL